jgi:hypothetical protein
MRSDDGRSHGFVGTPTEKENVMPSDSELTYGLSTDWQPERPRLRLFPLAVSWLVMGIALMVAAGVPAR